MIFRKKYIWWGVCLLGLVLLLLGSVCLSLSTGELNLNPIQAFSLLLSDGSSHPVAYELITQIRWPRILLGIGVGGALSLSGVILQGIFRNPLVEPFTLGISGGASLGVAVVIVTGLHILLGAFILPLAGFAGAFLVILLVYTISVGKGGVRVQHMLLVGVMVSFIASSAMMFLMSVSNTEELHGIVFWMMGSLDEPNHQLISLTLITTAGGLFLSYFFVQPLNALRLGEEKALHLGIDTNLTIRILFVLSSLLAGICVSVAGVIGFVGLIIPHILRMFLGSDYRILLVSSCLLGSSFMVLSDLLARTIIAPNELPIGVITGLIGGVVFIVLMVRKQRHLSVPHQN